MNRLKIGIVGAGAIGGTVATILTNKGYDVEVANRYNSQFPSSNKSQFNIIGEFGNISSNVKIVNGVKNFSSKKDIIFIFTKANNANVIAKLCNEYLNNDGIIVSNENIMNLENMLSVIDETKFYPLIINWEAKKINKTNMEIFHFGNMIIGNIGKLDEMQLNRLQKVLSNIAPTEISLDIIDDIWTHVIANNVLTSVCVLSGLNFYKTLKLPYAKKIITDLICECVVMANSVNIKLKKYGAVNYYCFYNNNFKSKRHRKSALKWLKKQHGKIDTNCFRAIQNNEENELDFLCGYFVNLSKTININLPVHKNMFKMLQEIVNGTRFMNKGNLYELYNGLKEM